MSSFYLWPSFNSTQSFVYSSIMGPSGLLIILRGTKYREHVLLALIENPALLKQTLYLEHGFFLSYHFCSSTEQYYLKDFLCLFNSRVTQQLRSINIPAHFSFAGPWYPLNTNYLFVYHKMHSRISKCNLLVTKWDSASGPQKEPSRYLSGQCKGNFSRTSSTIQGMKWPLFYIINQEKKFNHWVEGDNHLF